MEQIFIDIAEQQGIVHWLGQPYIVESSHGGRFYNVMDIWEQSIDFKLEGIILDKFFKMKPKAVAESECK